MLPHADFACLSRKCQQDGAASVYDLPVTATRCPVCGSKRVQRLYNSPPGVMRSGARALQRTIDQAGSEMEAAQHTREDAVATAQRAGVPEFAVPVAKLGAYLAPFGATAPAAGGSRPTPVAASILKPVLGRPIHRHVQAVDKEYRVTKTADGDVQAVKA